MFISRVSIIDTVKRKHVYVSVVSLVTSQQITGFLKMDSHELNTLGSRALG